MTLTSDSPASVVAARRLALELGQGGGGEPTGDPVITSVVDNGDGTLTIQGGNFGSKAQTAPVLVDYADHAYENGVLNDYHSTFTDGQVVTNAQSDPNELWYTSFTSDVYGANTNLLSRSSQQRHAQSQAHYRCRGDDAGFGGPMANGGETPSSASTKMYLAWWLRRKYTDLQFHVVLSDLSGSFIADEPITINGVDGFYIGSHVRSEDGKTAHSFEMSSGSRLYGTYYGTAIVGVTSGATATFPATGSSTESPNSYVVAGAGTKLTRLRDNSNNQHLRSSHSLTDYFAFCIGAPNGYERTDHAPPQARDQWFLVEEMVVIDPETETGKHFIHVNGKAWPKGTSEPFATFDASTRDPSKNIWPSWIGNNAYEFLQQTDLDEIYFDTTLQRVYLGDAATISECSHLEIQRPQAWANGAVSVVKHEAGLSGQDQWVYVAGPDGLINEQGYAL